MAILPPLIVALTSRWVSSIPKVLFPGLESIISKSWMTGCASYRMAFKKLIRMSLLSVEPNIFFERKVDFGIDKSHCLR